MKPVQSLTLDDGTVAVTYDQVRDTWHNHFASIEAAVDVEPANLLDEARRIQAKMFATVNYDPEAVPNIFELCASFLAASRNRSTGPDGIPDELFAICCLQMVRLYAPLYMKTALRFETAVSWVGGTLFELFKGSGLHKLAANWRAILSSISAPKRY